ncbi:MAG: hypothetical protein WC966_11225 [Bradymonadales bacterium]|jgi:hypothetical protein
MRQIFLLFVVLGLVGGCVGSEEWVGKECNAEGAMKCLQGATRYVQCEGGVYVEKVCGQGLQCRGTSVGDRCVLSDGDAGEGRKCEEGCSEGGYVMECVGDEQRMRRCAAGLVCREGECVEQSCLSGKACTDNEDCVEYRCVMRVPECLSNEDCPENYDCIDAKCEEKQEREYIIRTTCTADGKGLVHHYENTTLSRSCLEHTGLDTKCRVFDNDNAGCEMPISCGDTVSEAGTCIDENTVNFCVPEFNRSIILDCRALGMRCAEIRGRASCVQTCSQLTGVASCRMAENAYLADLCVSTPLGNIVDTRSSHCRGDKQEQFCSQLTLSTRDCPADELCNEELGHCTKACENEGKYSCVGAVLRRCEFWKGSLFWIKQKPRLCNDEWLVYCSGEVLREVDCANYPKDGEIVHGYCDDIAGGAICYGEPRGEPCGEDYTKEGLCDGSVLKFCNTRGAQIDLDCAKLKDGRTKCSSFDNYKDCRVPCTKEGSASCFKDDNTGNQIVNLCTKDDSGSLVQIQNNALCFGSELLSCDEKGKIVKNDCSHTGGDCKIFECVYPNCEKDAPYCTGERGDVLKQCKVLEDGYVVGSTLSTPVCGQEGVAQACYQGTLRRCSGL